MALTTNTVPCSYLARFWKYANTVETMDAIWIENHDNPCHVIFGSLRSALNGTMIIYIGSATTVAIIHQNWMLSRRKPFCYSRNSAWKGSVLIFILATGFWCKVRWRLQGALPEKTGRAALTLSNKPHCPAFRFWWLASGCSTTG